MPSTRGPPVSRRAMKLHTFVVPMSTVGFVALAYFVIVGTSNAVNLTDGLDGLAIMPAVLVAAALGVFAHAASNAMDGMLAQQYGNLLQGTFQQKRRDAQARNGWIMDTYLLRRRT